MCEVVRIDGECHPYMIKNVVLDVFNDVAESAQLIEVFLRQFAVAVIVVLRCLVFCKQSSQVLRAHAFATEDAVV